MYADRYRIQTQPRACRPGSISLARVSASPVAYATQISRPTSISRRGVRADLVVGAVAAGAPRGGRVEPPGANAGGRRPCRMPCHLEVVGVRRVATDDV